MQASPPAAPAGSSQGGGGCSVFAGGRHRVRVRDDCERLARDLPSVGTVQAAARSRERKIAGFTHSPSGAPPRPRPPGPARRRALVGLPRGPVPALVADDHQAPQAARGSRPRRSTTRVSGTRERANTSTAGANCASWRRERSTREKGLVPSASRSQLRRVDRRRVRMGRAAVPATAGALCREAHRKPPRRRRLRPGASGQRGATASASFPTWCRATSRMASVAASSGYSRLTST